MKKKNKSYIFFINCFLILLFVTESFASENPYFLTLKNSEVNLRQGPSFEYPVKLIYKKKVGKQNDLYSFDLTLSHLLPKDFDRNLLCN